MELNLSAQVHEKRVASDGVVGMVFLLAAEAMFFAGLISAYIVNRAAAVEWPPFGQPRLPVAVTAVNTLVLLASGLLMALFTRKNKTATAGSVQSTGLFRAALALGALFLLIQGSEWVRLIHFGLTSRSSLYGAFFYTIIGAHGFHVFAGLLALLYLNSRLNKTTKAGNLKSTIDSIAIYWGFVVAIWPVLYYLVYLS